MSEFIVTNKTIAIFLIIFLVVAVMVGVVSYNLGVKNGLEYKAPTNTYENNSQSTTDTNQPINNAEEITEPETVISGEPVISGEATILSGRVTVLNSSGFTMESTSNVVNSQTGQLTETKTIYQVSVNNQTKITQVISALTIPPQGGPTKVTTTTRNSSLSNIKVGNTVSITTASDLETRQLTATEIKITS